MNSKKIEVVNISKDYRALWLYTEPFNINSIILCDWERI